jgi:hypothetical protein
MKHAARAAIAALVLSAAAMVPVASAYAGHACKSAKEEEATVPGVGPGATRAATRAAIAAWKKEVATEVGPAYARWSKAKEKKIRCHTKFGKATECEAEAKPCAH